MKTNDDVALDLYESHQKLYPREVSGRFARLRIAAGAVLLGVYYGLPWLQWDGRQAVLFDLPARRFHIFALTLWPQDFLYLAWLLILAALALFFFTALAGRVWCGYACPQSVWTGAFLGIERLVEGRRPQRLKLDRQAWTAEWIARKAVKQALWIAYATFTGFTFVAYFTPARELAVALAGLRTGGWEAFWIAFYGFATYANAGFLREQVCRYLCPYARFQSAMFDRDTLIVSYDASRGEPRGARGRGVDPRALGRGDCTDCTICVQVCPMGIDIRKGLQYECIACAACVDGCNDVMDRLGYPRGLIRYATARQAEGGRQRVIRPRIVLYGALLASLFAGFVISLALRVPVGLEVLRDRNALYRLTADGAVENAVTLRILNKDNHSHRFVVDVEPPGALEIETEAIIEVPAATLRAVPARVRIEAAALPAAPKNATIVVTAADEQTFKAHSTLRFLVPRSRP